MNSTLIYTEFNLHMNNEKLAFFSYLKIKIANSWKRKVIEKELFQHSGKQEHQSTKMTTKYA